jgi:hypothetical protein
MSISLDLFEETLLHFQEGAKAVKAHTNENTYVITKASEHEYWVALEEPGFPKSKTTDLKSYFKEVFGIEARY